MDNNKSKPLFTKSNIKFGVISDPQIGDIRQEKNKVNAINSVLKENVDFVLYPGDLTTRGFNKVLFNWFVQKLIYNDFIRPNNSYKWDDQLNRFINQFIKPLENKNIKTFCIRGNHDTYTGPIHPVKNWIKKKYGGLNYKVNLHDKLDLICIDIYPNKKNCDWLKKQLDITKNIIIMFHYPPKGSFSNEPWWTDNEKKYFYNIISNYKIKLLCIGHLHFSEQYQWNNIQVINGGGYKVGIVEVNLNSDDIDIKLV